MAEAQTNSKVEPTTVYMRDGYYTVKEPSTKELDSYLASKTYRDASPALKDAIRREYEEKTSVDSEEVENWRSVKFQSSVADWLKTHTSPVTNMRAVLRFVTLSLAQGLSSYEEHEANRKSAGYTIESYLDMLKPQGDDAPILSPAVRKRYAEESEKNKKAMKERLPGKSA